MSNSPASSGDSTVSESDSSIAAAPQCSTRLCPKLSVGIGPVSGLALCATHLERDVSRATDRLAKLLRSLRLVREPVERQQALKQEFEALTSQLTYVQDTFEAMRESINLWSDMVVSHLQQALDSVARKLSDTTEAIDCERELTLTGSESDKRKVMELVKSTELWLEEANERSSEFRRTRGSTRDLVAGVQQLQIVIDRHIAHVMAPQVEPVANAAQHSTTRSSTGPCTQPLYPVIKEASLSCQYQQASAPPPPQLVCRPVAFVASLPSEPHQLTVCTNTKGFVCDSNNRVAKVSPAAVDPQTSLPQPSIVVSFLPECVDYLLVTSLTGNVKIRFHCNLDWQVWINGLHCDNPRQLLFIAQANAVTVATLSGEVTRVINALSLGVSVDWISSIAGSDDQVFILDIGKDAVQCVNKESGLLVSQVCGGSNGFGGMHELAQHGDALLIVAKSGQVHRLSMTDPSRKLGCLSNVFQRPPWKAAVDSAGQLLFATQPDSNSVRILSLGGGSGVQLLQTITGTSGDDATNAVCPRGLSVVQLPGDSTRRLVVADSAQMRLLVYEIL